LTKLIKTERACSR